MDIICKCGHDAKEHVDFYGCMFNSCKRPGDGCKCELSEAQVQAVYITEQQARLDTNRAQVTALIAERDALNEKLGYSQQENCELRQEREKMKHIFHRIIGNLDNRQVLLETCDKVLRDVFNA